MKSFLFFLMIIVFQVLSVDAQNLDSLFNNFVDEENNKQKIEIANKIFKILREQDYFQEEVIFSKSDDYMYANVYYWRGEIAFEQNNPELSAQSGKEAIKYIEKINDLFMLSDCLNLIAISELTLGNYQNAIDYFNQCYLIDLKTDDKSRISSSLNFLSEVYLQINNPQNAEKYILKSIEIEEKLGRDAQLAIRYGRASAVYLKLKKYPLALEYVTKAYNLDSIGNRTEKMAVRLSQTADVYMAMDSNNLAINTLNHALEIFEQTNNQKYIAVCCQQIAKVYAKNNEYNNAVKYYNKSLNLCQQMGLKPLERDIENGLYNVFKNINSDSALSHLENYIIINDSIKTNETQKTISNLEIKYQTEALKKDNAAKKRENKIIICISIVLIIIFIIATAMMASALKTKSKAQKTSEKLAKAREEFFTNITHELRTPLTVILGMAERLSKNTLTKDETPESTGKIILRQSKNLYNLVENLLDFSKIKSALNPPQTKNGDIIKHIETLTENFKQYAADKNVELKFSSNIEKLNAVYPNDYLDKILNNLISNAIKYSKSENGYVNVSLNYDNKTLTIKISDNGIGISPENINRIFDYFFRENKAENKSGTGIGLALTNLCVKAIGGRITVDSQLDKGSEFTVTMPLQKLPDLENQPNKNNENSTQKKILIVEDNADILYFISTELQSNYEIFNATDGIDGLNKASEIVPDLIISDIMMPNLNGLQMAEQIHKSELLNHIPLIFLTAKTTEKDKIIGLNAGAVAYLYKPFNTKELNAIVENLLTMRDNLKKRYSQAVNLYDKMPKNEPKNEQKQEKSTPKTITQSNPNDIKFLEKFNKYLSIELKKGTFDAETMASDMCLSRSQLNRKILALTGLNTTAYIINQRINLAKKLLKDDFDLQVGDIAMQCGFEDVSYFSRIFKQITGCTPRDYRKN